MFLRLEKETSTRKITLSDDQIKLLERFSPEFRERHIQVSFPGELVAVDTFFVGTLKGIGKVYLQTVLDCYSRYAWARLYPNKLPLTAVQIMNNDALPFFEDHHIPFTLFFRIMARNSVPDWTNTPFNFLYSWKPLIIATPKSAVPRAMGTSSGFIGPFRTSISGFRDEPNFMKLLVRCSRILMFISSGTIWRELLRVET